MDRQELVGSLDNSVEGMTLSPELQHHVNLQLSRSVSPRLEGTSTPLASPQLKPMNVVMS